MTQQSLFHKQDEQERLEAAEREKQEREKHPPIEFMITLFDGTPVRVVFTLRYFSHASHFAFHGDMTNTGYRSHFTGDVLEGWTEQDIREKALDVADASRKEFLEQQRKEERNAERKKRAPAFAHANQP